VKLKGLGRGLDALLDKDGESGPVSERQATLRIDQLQRGRYQPRTRMDDSSLEELAASIRTQGLMQPVLVRLIGEFKLTHQEAAEAIGRSRAATTNLLRLLNLQKAVQALVFDGKLEMGHARALLALDGRQQESVAKRVADRTLSVRQTEQLVNAILHPTAKT